MHTLGCRGQLQVPISWQVAVAGTHNVVGASVGSKGQGQL